MRTTTTLGMVVVLALVAGCGSAPKESRAPASEAPASEATAVGGAGYPSAFAASPAAASPASAAPAAASRGASSPAAATDGAGASIASEAAPPPPPPSSPLAAPEPRPAPNRPQAGQLTAGIWDDNRNFDFWKPYQTRFVESRGSDFAMFSARELEEAHAAAARKAGARTELDVQLVLDTTGSMGDELSYLQSEFDAIAAQVKTKFPAVTPRWSLVVYRDHGDSYVTRPFDFSADTARFRRDLAAQSAGGGGDTPEAVIEGLGAGLQQQWRTQENVAKIVFWVADAPAHPGEGGKLATVLREAKKKGVHIYPIASSDADDAAEYQMRSAAQLTSGRYVFLTSDSGIGNSHAEPHIPCYNVSRLDHAIVRMIEVEMSGTFAPVAPGQVVRSVGSPDRAGTCKLPSGMLVASY